MRQQRNIAVCIILSIVTCGIYGIYWFITLTDEVNMATGTSNDTSGGMAFLFTLITCGIYGIYWGYKMGQKIDNYHTRSGGTSSLSIIFLLLNLFGLFIVTYALAQNELNDMV